MKVLKLALFIGAGVGISYASYRIYKAVKNYYQHVITVEDIKREKLIQEVTQQLEEMESADFSHLLSEDESEIDPIVEELEDISPKDPVIDYTHVAVEQLKPWEVKDLKYGPNTTQAYEQFIRLNLIDIESDYQELIDLVGMLFDYDYSPRTLMLDMNAYDNMLDIREQFFGRESSWSRGVSYGDLVCYYANKLTEELELSYTRALYEMLHGIFWDPENNEYYDSEDDLIDITSNIETVIRYDGNGRGLFGLSEFDTQHLTIAEQFETFCYKYVQ